jgi:hypothetical protein
MCNISEDPPSIAQLLLLYLCRSEDSSDLSITIVNLRNPCTTSFQSPDNGILAVHVKYKLFTAIARLG